jgi:2-oxoglutarate ferredoxin oxidoreductase subunit gamma
MTSRMLIAGFGGQGIMLMGELLSYAAMLDGKQVTYMPSYGPEMRGGTANCSVIVSDEGISSPIVTEPNVLVAMNEPSLDRFEDSVTAGGFLFINESLISRKPRRDDVRSCFVDCTRLAQSVYSEKIANIVMLGAVIHERGIVSFDSVNKAMESKLTGNKATFIPVNRTALTVWAESAEGCA